MEGGDVRKGSARERLLEAAFRAFSEKGYLGTTTREIALKAGVAEVTLFRHFDSKERLFEEVLKTYTFLPKLKGIIPEIRELAYEEAMRIIGLEFLKTLKEEKALVMIMLSEVNLYPEKVRTIHHRFIDEILSTLSSYLRDLQERGLLRDFDPSLGARAFLGMVFSYFKAEEIVKGRDLKEREMEDTVDGFVRIFVEGTKGR